MFWSNEIQQIGLDRLEKHFEIQSILWQANLNNLKNFVMTNWLVEDDYEIDLEIEESVKYETNYFTN